MTSGDPEQASRSRIETIRDGLRYNPDYRPVWIRAAQARIEELNFRKALFELEPYETEETRALQELIAPYEQCDGHKSAAA